MNDTQDPKQPAEPEGETAPDPSSPLDAAESAEESPGLQEPEPSSEVPEGLAPSPGLAPPTGIQPPQSFEPAPMYAPPVYQPAPQYQAPVFEQQPFQQPAFQAPQDQSSQFHQDPQYLRAPHDPSQPAPYSTPGQYNPSGVPPKKGLPTGAIIGIVAGAVVLLLVIIGGIALIGSLANRSSPYIDEPVYGASSPEAVEKVEDYLTALADGDAKTARAIIGETTDTSLLTDEVLAASNELAPISNIVVDVDDSYTIDSVETIVPATFDIGDETVTRDFSVWNFSDDEWEIFDGLVNISFTALDGMDFKVNGVEPSSDYVPVFVGAYQITLDKEEFTLSGGTDTFVIADRDDASELYSVRPELTAEATKTFRDLVRASLAECLTSTALTTPCGIDVSRTETGGVKVVDGTVQRKLTTEGEAALNSLSPSSSYSTPMVISSHSLIRVDVTADTEKDGEVLSGVKVFAHPLMPYVDFGQETLKVTWE